MSRNFTMVSPALWRSPRIGALDSDGRVLFFFLLTSEHSNSAGCFRMPPAYACSDLGWTLDRYDLALSAIVSQGLAGTDSKTGEVFIERWFHHSPPTNLKHALGTMSVITRIESDDFREKAEAEFAATKFGAQVLQPETNVHDLSQHSRLAQTRAGGGRL